MIAFIAKNDGMFQNNIMMNDLGRHPCFIWQCVLHPKVACATYQVQILLPLVFSHDEYP